MKSEWWDLSVFEISWILLTVRYITLGRLTWNDPLLTFGCPVNHTSSGLAAGIEWTTKLGEPGQMKIVSDMPFCEYWADRNQLLVRKNLFANHLTYALKDVSNIKLDAHGMRPVGFLGACVWFRDVMSFSDASGMVCVRVKVSLMCPYGNRLYSNAHHTRRIRKGRDITKLDPCAQKTHWTHSACIQL